MREIAPAINLIARLCLTADPVTSIDQTTITVTEKISSESLVSTGVSDNIGNNVTGGGGNFGSVAASGGHWIDRSGETHEQSGNTATITAPQSIWVQSDFEANFEPAVLFPGVSAWTNIGNIANTSILPENLTIGLDTASYFHIFARHVRWPIPGASRYASQFRNVNAINGLFNITVNSTTGIPQGNGNYYFSAGLGSVWV